MFITLISRIVAFEDIIVIMLMGIIDDEYVNINDLVVLSYFGTEIGLKFITSKISQFLKYPFIYTDLIIITFSTIQIILRYKNYGRDLILTLYFFRVLRLLKIFNSNHFIKSIFNFFSSQYKHFLEILIFFLVYVTLSTFIVQFIFPKMYHFKEEDIIYTRFYSTFINVLSFCTMDSWSRSMDLYSDKDHNTIVIIVATTIISFIGNLIFLNLMISMILESFLRYFSIDQTDKADKTHNNKRKSVIINSPIHHRRKTLNWKIEKESPLKKKTTLSTYLSMHTNRSQIFMKRIHCEKTLFFFTRENPIRMLFVKISYSMSFSVILSLTIFVNLIQIFRYLNEDRIFSCIYCQRSNYFDIVIQCVILIVFTFEFLVEIISKGFIGCKESYCRSKSNLFNFLFLMIMFIQFSINVDQIFILKKMTNLLIYLFPSRLILNSKTAMNYFIKIIKSFNHLWEILATSLMIWFY